MKKLLMLALCVAITGCINSKPAKKPADAKMAAVPAEQKLAQKLPLGVDPGSINAQNALTKANDELAGIEREKKRLASAGEANNQVK